jgi:thymidylate synthase (FAD)
MYLIKPSHAVEKFDGVHILKNIERCGRKCYKSEHMTTEDSYLNFIQKLILRGHESVIEHEKISVDIVCDRGISHELVRHRLCSFSQESTRYCNYGKEGVTFILPFWTNIDSGEYTFLEHIDDTKLDHCDLMWYNSCLRCERDYLDLLKCGWKPEQARSVLNNSLKTELTITANLREWRHIFRIRTHKSAHPQMREIMDKILIDLKEKLMIVFDDIE